jgi:hypothetical protein
LANHATAVENAIATQSQRNWWKRLWLCAGWWCSRIGVPTVSGKNAELRIFPFGVVTPTDILPKENAMRVFRFENLQSLNDLTLHDEPMPEPQRGEVLVKIHAVSVNRRDILIVQGDYPGVVTPGLVPCSDAAGEIVAVGDDVTAYRLGDRVISAGVGSNDSEVPPY